MIRIPSGLNATLYTSGYVECAYGGFGEGCRKRYDFVPYMDLPDGWITKDGNSHCFRYLIVEPTSGPTVRILPGGQRSHGSSSALGAPA